MDIPVPKFQGFNNRDADGSLPKNKLRNAVNLAFRKNGETTTRPGSEKVYSGNIHSLYQYNHDLGLALFGEGIYLKRLNHDYSATTLATVGDTPLSFCRVEEFIYYANATSQGIYYRGQIKPWGLDNPPNQPTVTSVSGGGLYAGEYQAAITWLNEISPGHYQESGTGASVKANVSEGGGLYLTGLPTPPSEVSRINVYVSDLNGKDLYLYNSYPSSQDEIHIGYKVNSVKLKTQFLNKIRPGELLTVFNGRILWKDGKLIRFTPTHYYGVYQENHYFRFEEEPTNIIALPQVLYVTTDTRVYRLVQDEVSMSMVEVKTYGVPKGLVCFDNTNKIAFALGTQAYMRFDAEKVIELDAKNISPPTFQKGAMALIQNEGDDVAVAIGRKAIINGSQHSDYTTIETNRGAKAKWA